MRIYRKLKAILLKLKSKYDERVWLLGLNTEANRNPSMLDRQFSVGPIPNLRTMHDELISIIMPSYNNGEWIARAIHSALSQQGVKIELLVVDDGSTDDSVAIARKIAAHWPNMRVISLLRNFGCYYARNVGVMASSGDYVTIIDSDDIMTPDRIFRQMNALKASPGKRASLARTRRWSDDFGVALNEARYAENTLLWDRRIVGEIGYYDTVRFGGDTEFRVRIESAYGRDTIVRIPDEVYFLRTLESSLTNAAGSNAYTVESGALKLELSPARREYSDNLSVWYKSASKAGVKDLKVNFPQLSRTFALGSVAQNASPSLGQRRVGTMASFPPRRDGLKLSIDSILPQLDQLIVYLNGYEGVPEFLRDPKIRIVRSQDALGDLRDNGKFFDLPQEDDAYVFTLDDDLIYPPDYVAKMIFQIEMLGRSVVVGVHGANFPDGEFTRLNQRTVFHFAFKKPGRFVDLLGTGTTAWHSSTLKLSLSNFETKGVSDLWFAAAAAQQSVPLYSVARDTGWLVEQPRSDTSLWQETVSAPQAYWDVYNKVVAPALDGGLIRRRMEASLSGDFSPDTLAAAGIELSREPASTDASVRLAAQSPGATVMAAAKVRPPVGASLTASVLLWWSAIQQAGDVITAF